MTSLFTLVLFYWVGTVQSVQKKSVYQATLFWLEHFVLIMLEYNTKRKFCTSHALLRTNKNVRLCGVFFVCLGTWTGNQDQFQNNYWSNFLQGPKDAFQWVQSALRPPAEKVGVMDTKECKLGSWAGEGCFFFFFTPKFGCLMPLSIIPSSPQGHLHLCLKAHIIV